MKKIFSFAIATLTILSLTLTSCGKYEDGPGFTLRSKKARLCQVWVPKLYIDGASGTETAAGANDGTIEYTKDEVCKLTYGGTTFTGTWAFANDKEAISTNFSGVTGTSTILRLTMKELWTKDTDGDITHFEAQ